jgi:isopentenyl diphosphate isomerase/L-lactate dehydrogenase-like FMN-dependent dehydrogenase
MNRRVFLAGSAAVLAVACGGPTPCNDFNPEWWDDVSDAENAARKTFGRTVSAWEGVEGSAEATQRFRDSLNRFTLRPRTLVDVSTIDASTTLMGQPASSPILYHTAAGITGLARFRNDAEIGARAGGAIVARSNGDTRDGTDGSAGAFLTIVPWRALPSASTPSGQPLIAGGIRSADDARAAVQQGARAVVITPPLTANDIGPSSLELVTEVREAVPRQTEVFVEGPFRHGNEILIARALGANAAVVSLPVIWGTAAEGAPGAQRVIEMLTTQLALGMGMCGRPKLANISRDMVRVHRA